VYFIRSAALIFCAIAYFFPAGPYFLSAVAYFFFAVALFLFTVSLFFIALAYFLIEVSYFLSKVDFILFTHAHSHDEIALFFTAVDKKKQAPKVRSDGALKNSIWNAINCRWP
jgi:hypothetical protein